MAAAAQIPPPIETISFSSFAVQPIQARLNRLIRNGLIPGYPIFETGRVDSATATAVQAFCETFAIDATVRFGSGAYLSKPRKTNVPPPLMSRFKAPSFGGFNLLAPAAATFNAVEYLRPGSTAMQVLQWAVDHSEGPISQMTPEAHVKVAEAMLTAGNGAAPSKKIDFSIHAHIPLLTGALIGAKQKFGFDLDTTGFLITALATIAAENSSFEPRDEDPNYKGRNNNSAYEDFDVYERFDKRREEDRERVSKARARAEKEHPERHPVRVPGQAAGANLMPGDGALFKGRGWVQLTHRDLYESAGRALGLDLAANPDLAGEPETGAQIMAWYLATRGLVGRSAVGHYQKVCDDIARNDTTALRRMVNGGTNGLKPFSDAYWGGKQFFRQGYILRVTRMGLNAAFSAEAWR